MSYFQDNHPFLHTLKDGGEISYTLNVSKEDLDLNKTTLVFNYGLVCSNHHWKFQLDYFDKAGYQILIHDYRGHYQSEGSFPVETCTFENFSRDVKEILDSLNIQKAYFIGHSMGVNVTLELAHLYPQLTRGFCVISGTVLPPQDIMFNTAALNYIESAAKWAYRKLPKTFNLFWKNAYKSDLAVKSMRSGGFNTEKVNPDFVAHYMKKIGELNPHIFFQLLKEMENHHIIRHLHKIESSALVIGGDEDQVIPNHFQFYLNDKLPNSKMIVINKGSHVPQADFPDQINGIIEMHLQDLRIF